MDARVGAAALVVGAGLLAACSTTATAVDSSPAVRAGDPAYAFAQLRQAPEGDDGVVPATLEDALPNHRLRLRGTGQVATFSDALVLGTVMKVVKGHGVIWRDDDDFTVVDFDDPRADTRTAYVTITTDEVVGKVDPDTGSVTFRVLLPSAADADDFVGGLAGLGRIAVVLTRDPNRAEDIAWRPIMNDSLIGVIADGGRLSLPALRRGAAFTGDIHTASDVLTAARAPVSTTTVDVP